MGPVRDAGVCRTVGCRFPTGPWAFKDLPANKLRLVHVLRQVKAAKNGSALRRINDGAIKWHYSQLVRLAKPGAEENKRRTTTKDKDLDEVVRAHRMAPPKRSRKSGRRKKRVGVGTWGGRRPGTGPKPLFGQPMTPAERKRRQRGLELGGSQKKRK